VESHLPFNLIEAIPKISFWYFYLVSQSTTGSVFFVPASVTSRPSIPQKEILVELGQAAIAKNHKSAPIGI
jgi:hypothetical protein